MSVPSFSLAGLASKHTVVEGDGTERVDFDGPVALKCLADGNVEVIGYNNADDVEVTYPVLAGEVLSIVVKSVVTHSLGAGNLIAWE